MRLYTPDNLLVKLIVTVERFVDVRPKLASKPRVIDVKQVQWYVIKHVTQIWRQTMQLMLRRVRQNLLMLQVKDQTSSPNAKAVRCAQHSRPLNYSHLAVKTSN